MIRVRIPSPFPDRAAFPAALARDAPILTRLHRLAVKTAWLIDSAGLHTEAAQIAVAELATSAASLGTLRRELGNGDATAAYEGLRDRLAQIGACANALRCIVLDETLAGRLAEIAFAAVCLDRALIARLAPRPTGHGIPCPHGATVAAWRERFPDWALIADGWIMATA